MTILRTLFIFVCTLFLPFILYAQFPKTVLKAGSPIKVSPLYDISSKEFKEGQNVNFICTENVLVDDKIVIMAKSPVFAVIQKAEKAKSMGKEGTLRVSFKNVMTIDGQIIPLYTEDAEESGKNRSKSATALAMFVSPLFLLKKGKNAILTKDQVMEAFVAKDSEINVR